MSGNLLNASRTIQNRRPNLEFIEKYKRTCLLVDFADPENHREKMKGTEKMDNLLDLARHLKEFMDMLIVGCQLEKNHMEQPPKSSVQSVGAVECTDNNSAEGKDSPNECPRYDTTQSSVIMEPSEMRSATSLPSLNRSSVARGCGTCGTGVVAPE